MFEAKRPALLLRARRAFLAAALASPTGYVTIESVRGHLPDGFEAWADPRFLGGVGAPLARMGIVKRDGFVELSRPESHARPVTRWQLLDRAAAERWLADNPEPVEVLDP